MQQIMICHVGHFLLELCCQIWTHGTLRHILEPILLIFEICHFLTIPVLSLFQKKGPLKKFKVFLMN